MKSAIQLKAKENILNSQERHLVTNRLLSWLPCIVALAAIVLRYLDSRDTPFIRNIDHTALYILMLFPMVMGAVFYHFNQRRVIRWLLVIFLGGNFLLWTTYLIGICFDCPGGVIIGLFMGVMIYLYAAFPNIGILVAILCLWVAVNAWEMIKNG